jgi:hypothetical protein
VKLILLMFFVWLMAGMSGIGFGWWFERVHAQDNSGPLQYIVEKPSPQLLYKTNEVPEPQVVGTVPVVSGCATTSSVTVCTLTDPATQRHWLIVGSAQGSIAVVPDELR